jgi:hypothetical protein
VYIYTVSWSCAQFGRGTEIECIYKLNWMQLFWPAANIVLYTTENPQLQLKRCTPSIWLFEDYQKSVGNFQSQTIGHRWPNMNFIPFDI